MYLRIHKPTIDFLLSLSALLLLLPLFVIITLSLAIANSSNPFFTQARAGKNARFYKIIKFKTMTDKCDAQGNYLPDEKRLTNFGKMLRKTSLDEIPQLVNVFKGDMSLVGPRPLLPEYLLHYTKEQARRHEVKPGITGWAQVNGRNAISWEEKFKLDVWYVDRLSFALDIKILFMTLVNVLKRKDISKEGHATTVAFNGKN